jgi:hypothetical protein
MQCSGFIVPLVFTAALFAAEPTAIHNRAPLQANAFNPLPLGSVKPRGWLRQQLRVQADGLSGHLDEFWPDLRDSAWLGGAGEGWERGPYYMDGLVPLAYLLDDPVLVEKARRWMGWMLDHTGSNGWLGPVKNTDWWPNFVALKALTQFQEATNDPRVIPVMQRYFAYQLEHVRATPLREWATYRWQDEVLSIVWLYNRTGDTRLLELAKILHDQGHDWEAQFRDFPFRGKYVAPKDHPDLATHGVNNGMALKTGGVWWLFTGNPTDREAPRRMLQTLDRYDGQPNGVFSCDEHYAGLSPSQGTELCTVVEEMFSLETLMSTVGDAEFGDREEKIAFNALPGTFDSKMWAHQYDQQVNQVLVSELQRDWVNNGPDSNLYGLEPNYGCCTANMHQGWPKFAANLWMATPDDGGLAAVFYAPCDVRTVLQGGVAVAITEETEYPFRDSIHMKIALAQPATFPLVLRIPMWTNGARILVNGEPAEMKTASGFATIARLWHDGDRVDLQFPMEVHASRWFDDSMVVTRGPLVYSLRIGEEWRKLKTHGPAADWEVLPTTPWNYALAIDPRQPGHEIEVIERPVGTFPFSDAGAPVLLKVPARRVPSWSLEKGSAARPPKDPAPGTPLETVTLIPYGAAKLRVTEFPVVR